MHTNCFALYLHLTDYGENTNSGDRTKMYEFTFSTNGNTLTSRNNFKEFSDWGFSNLAHGNLMELRISRYTCSKVH